MVALLKSIGSRMGSGSPMQAMLIGVMPLVESQIVAVDEANIRALAAAMADAFTRVGNDAETLEAFEVWLTPPDAVR